jgi:3-deoxy-D-manno-octulosonic-acid transferase
MHALRLARPDVQIAYSYFSPSAESLIPTLGAELSGYLPFDSAAAADRMLQALAPTLLCFVKLDVWPILVECAARRGTPVALVSATLSAGSGRQGRWSQALLHDAYASLSAVGAIDAVHADRLAQLGVRREVLQATGDTRFDQVAQRAAAVDRRSSPLSLLASQRPTVVAGSTWPADDAVLLDAWRRVHLALPTARLIIAPHEPTAVHCAPIVQWASDAGLSLGRLVDVERHQSGGDADVVLVDRVGVLGDLYALAQVAFVGGGFHAAGLHSVIEPAAFGVPVLFGPGHTMSREAGLLLEAKAAQTVADADALARHCQGWLTDEKLRNRAGEQARALVAQEQGATARALSLISGFLPPPRID